MVITYNPSHSNINSEVNAPFKMLSLMLRFLDNETKPTNKRPLRQPIEDYDEDDGMTANPNSAFGAVTMPREAELTEEEIVKRKKKNTLEIPRNACIISIAFGVSYVIFIVLMNITGLAIEIRAFALVIGLMLINIFRIPTYLKFAFKKNEHNQRRSLSVKKQRVLERISAQTKRQSLKRLDSTISFLNVNSCSK